MNDYFDREHLAGLKDKERRNLIFYDYPKCRGEGVKLKTLDHFTAHVMNVYGVELRPSHQAKPFPKPAPCTSRGRKSQRFITQDIDKSYIAARTCIVALV
jgi:hypothetical protein